MFIHYSIRVEDPISKPFKAEIEASPLKALMAGTP
jgi:hypothetical protein